MNRDNSQTVSVPTWVLAGLIRSAQFLEQEPKRADGFIAWDDKCREALEYVRNVELDHRMLELHGPADYRRVRPELPY